MISVFSSLIPSLHVSLLKKKKKQQANECSFATRVELDLKPAALVLVGKIIHVFMSFYCYLLLIYSLPLGSSAERKTRLRLRQ